MNPSTSDGSTGVVTRLRREMWESTEAFDRGGEKAAASLSAVAATLTRRQPLAGRESEFLELYARVRAADPVAFTTVWTFPTAYAWSRDTYELARAALDGVAFPRRQLPAEAVPDALLEMLDGFKAFVAAIFQISKGTIQFQRPLAVELPFALPGSGQTLLGSAGRAEILGVSSGALDVRSREAVRLERAPHAQHAGFEILLDPHALRCCGTRLAPVENAIGFGRHFHTDSAALVGEALARIERHAPQSYLQLRSLMRCMALRPGSDDEDASSVSYSDLPGACIASLVPNAFEVGDTLLHEFHHNRLFLIEEDGPLFPPTTEQTSDERHYSPWRPDARPLRGLFHGLYVFQPVARYWLDVLDCGEASGPLAGYAADSVARAAIRCEIAVRMIERHARLSPRGRAFLGELDRDTHALHADMAARGISGALPAWLCAADGSFEREVCASGAREVNVWESIRSHIERFDTDKECANFLSDLALL